MSAKRKRSSAETNSASKKDLADAVDVESAMVERNDSFDAVAVAPDVDKVFVVVCQQVQVLKKSTEIKVFADKNDAEEFAERSQYIPIGNGRRLHREVLLCTTNIQPSKKNMKKT